MDATQFIRDFDKTVYELRPRGRGSEWTAGIYEVLKRIGRNNNYIVRCQGSPEGGELYNVDFIYFPNRAGVSGQNNWSSPEVVIEHENEYKFDATAVDFWKLCHFVAPLRVMIGYHNSEEDAARIGEELVALYDDWDWRQSEDTETILLMGWYQNVGFRQWHRWRKKGSSPWEPYLTAHKEESQ